MIVAIEGPSAAGKTTWCRMHCANSWVQEAPYHIPAPDLYDDPAAVGRFWVKHNASNWQRALDLEREHGVAVCDGDPLHLYFSWSLWKARALDDKLFEVERELYRDAFAQRQMGFVDLVLWLEAPEAELRRRAKEDRVRPRKRHEIYLSLIPWMKTWFAAREHLLPGSVLPLRADLGLEQLPEAATTPRFDLAVLDKMIERLDSANS